MIYQSANQILKCYHVDLATALLHQFAPVMSRKGEPEPAMSVSVQNTARQEYMSCCHMGVDLI